MQNRVRVRRERPSALSWAIALAVTMLAVYLITLSAPSRDAEPQDVAAGARVTRQIEFGGATVHFAAMGSYPDEWQAKVAAAEVTGQGAAGIVRKHGEAWKVLGAGYELEVDARRISGNLAGQHWESEVVTLSAPGVSMRITAPEADAEAIVSAEATLRMQLGQMNSMALQVDRGEITYASARTLARVAVSEARKARQALQAVSGWQDQPVCRGLADQLERLEANLAMVTGGKIEGAALSGRLRACHVDGMLGLMDFLNALQ